MDKDKYFGFKTFNFILITFIVVSIVYSGLYLLILYILKVSLSDINYRYLLILPLLHSFNSSLSCYLFLKRVMGDFCWFHKFEMNKERHWYRYLILNSLLSSILPIPILVPFGYYCTSRLYERYRTINELFEKIDQYKKCFEEEGKSFNNIKYKLNSTIVDIENKLNSTTKELLNIKSNSIEKTRLVGMLTDNTDNQNELLDLLNIRFYDYIKLYKGVSHLNTVIIDKISNYKFGQSFICGTGGCRSLDTSKQESIISSMVDKINREYTNHEISRNVLFDKIDNLFKDSFAP